MPTSVFTQGTFLALETDRGSTPSATGSTPFAGAGGPWWNGGRRIPLITDGIPGVQDRQTVIFPTGVAGVRQINQQAPVVGRKWSDGDLTAPVVADMLGAFLYAAMGSLSSNMVPSTAPSLMASEIVNTNPKSFVLANQPDAGGNVLRFNITGQSNSAGTISVCGVDSYGNGASELISFGNMGTHYTRTSWSSIGGSSIAISGLSTATVTIFGIRNFVHTFTTASVAPTFSLERVGVPTAGNPASRGHVHPGMALTELTINTPAGTNDGIVTLDATMEGDPTAACNSASLNATSLTRIIPAWVLKVTRDGGTNWNVPTEFNITINAGNRNYLAAAGSQGPQGTFYGPQEITGNITLLVDNETEFNKWRGASTLNLYARWYSEWKLTASQNIEFGASLPFYLENAEIDEADDAFVLNADLRSVNDANWEIGQFSLTANLPGTAYGNAVV